MPTCRINRPIRNLLAACLILLPIFASADFPREWFWGEDDQRAVHQSLENRPLSLESMNLQQWHNGQPGDLKGQVVVIDFWATWCGPCLAAIPKLNALNAMDGVTVVGICGSGNGQDRMVEVADAHDMAYSTARDTNQSAARDWSVRWWPTYILVDQKGIVRAIGLSTAHVEDAVKALLAEGAEAPVTETASIVGASTSAQSPAIARGSIRPEWKEGDAARREILDPMHGKPAPALQTSNWNNTQATSLADLRGNIVVLDFWATWCGPCIASIPKNNAIAQKYADRGVVVLGVCHPRGGEAMVSTATEHGIRFPITLDHEGKTAGEYAVNGYPDYYVINRDGTLAVADVANSQVENVIQAMLAEEEARDNAPRPEGNAYLPGQAQGNATPLRADSGQITVRK